MCVSYNLAYVAYIKIEEVIGVSGMLALRANA